MTTLGVTFRPQEPPEQLATIARLVDDTGLDELWLWEDCFFESGVASASAALGWTTRPRVGVGIMPAPLRTVALMAMEVATLDRLFPDRFILGVGHGSQPWMAQAGVRVESPMTLLREYLTALKALLRGERVSTDGRYVRLDDVALHWPPRQPPKVYSGAVGPRTIRLSGELADGTILDGSTNAAGVRRARELIQEGQASAGRTDHHELIVNLNTATGPDAAARLRAENEFWGNESVPDLGAAGDAEAVAEAVTKLVEAGADRVVLVPLGDEEDLPGFVRFAADQVRPLLS